VQEGFDSLVVQDKRGIEGVFGQMQSCHDIAGPYASLGCDASYG
jgi:hypothetical protein